MNIFKGEYVYKICGLSDDDDQDVKQYFKEGIQFMQEATDEGGTVLVHCAAGISRSGSMMVAYVMQKEKMSLEESLKYVQARRKKVFPNKGFMKQLEEFEKELFG